MTDCTLPTWQVLTQMADCLCEAVSTSQLDPLCFCSVLPGGGQVAFDFVNGNCDESDGMGWVRLVTLYPTRIFPQPIVEGAGNCNSILAVGVEVGIVRSVPLGDEEGNPPDMATMMAVAQQQAEESELIRRAIACCYGNGALVGTYAPVGPGDGAIGGYWQFSAPSDFGG